jgi:NhaP-type Na+/H+ and K+/H+ antiporter
MELLLIPIHSLLLLVVILLCFLLSKWLKAPIILLYIAAGLFIGSMKYENEPIFYFPDFVVVSASIFVLSLLVFYSFSKLRINEFDTLTKRAAWLSAVIILLNLAFVSTSAFFIFHLSLVFSIVLALLASATSSDIIFPKKKHGRVTSLLEAESIISTPVMSIISILVLAGAFNWPANSSLSASFGVGIFSGNTFYGFLSTFKAIFISVGIGFVAALLVITIMKKKYLKLTSPVFLITAVVLSYLAAELFMGFGAAAAAVFGIVYGHSLIKEKKHITSVSSNFVRASLVFAFMLIALVIGNSEEKILSYDFILSSLLIFGIVLLVRIASVFVTFSKRDYNFRERLFLALNAPFGISAICACLTAVILFFYSPGAVIFSGEKTLFLSIVIGIVVYSLIVSVAVTRLSKYNYDSGGK